MAVLRCMSALKPVLGTSHRLPGTVATLLALLAFPSAAFAQAGNDPPVFPPIADPSVFEGTTATVDASATDPEGGPLAYSVTGPPWLTIDVNTGLCTLKPDYAAAQTNGGLHLVSVEVDDRSNLATTTFTAHALDAPTWASATLDQLFESVQGLDATFRAVPALGELVYDPPPDLALGGPMPLRFDRHYASIRAWEPSSSAFLPTTNFHIPYDWKLSVTVAGVTIVSDRGRVFRFQSVDPGGWALISPLDAPYQLVQQAGSYSFADPIGQMRYSFDAATLRLTSITDGNGNSHTLAYRGNLVEQVADGFGRVLSFGYDGQDRVVSVSDGTRTCQYSYNAATGELSAFTDALGQVTQYAYAPGPVPGLLTAVTLPGGNTPFTATYDLQQGRLLLDSDAGGGTRSYSAETIQSPLGVGATTTRNGASTFAHEWGHYDVALPYLLLLSSVDPGAGVTTYDYDAVGRLVTHTRPAGDTRRITYHAASGSPSSLLLPDGTTTTYTYAARNLGSFQFHDLVQANFPDGATNQWAYDAAGRVTQHTDAAGAVWSYAYNSSGQHTMVDPPGLETIMIVTYDAAGRATSLTSFSGNTTTYEYDALDRLTRVTHPDLTHRDYVYDALGRLTSWSNERSKVWTYQYNANGGLTLERDPLLLDNQFTYDALDRLVSWTDPLGGVTNFAYDIAGRLSSWTDRTARSTTYTYDALDRLIQRTDPGGNARQYLYDSNGRVIQETDPLNRTWQYQYDGLDRITRATDPLSNSTNYTYNAVARERRVIPPLGDQVTYSYTPRLQLARVRVGSPIAPTAQVSWTYSAWGAPLNQTDPNGQPWSLGYDVSGRLTSFTDPLARTTAYSYDSRDRLIQANTPVGALSYAYDAAGRLTSRTLGAGPAITYTYDDAGRLTSGTGLSRTLDALGRVMASDGVSYSYDAEGRLTGLSFVLGKTVTYSYDIRGLLTSVQDWAGGATAFTHNAVGKRTQMVRPNGTTVSYQYDAMDRVTRIIDGGAASILDLTFARDARGLITNAVRTMPHHAGAAAGTVSLAYDAASQIVGYTYDANGRLLQGGGRSYQWDLGSRLLQLDQPSGTVTYSYDCLDRMVTRDAGTARSYAWNEASGVPGIHVERQAAADFRYVVRTPLGELLHSVEAADNTRAFVHADERGGILAETSGAGLVAGMYSYNAKGRDSAHGSTGRYLYYPFRFGAGAVHEGQDLYRFGSLIYDAQTASPVTPHDVEFVAPLVGLSGGDLAVGGIDLPIRPDASPSIGYCDLPPTMEGGTGGMPGGSGVIDTGLRSSSGVPAGPSNPAPPTFVFRSYGIAKHGSGSTGGTGSTSGAPRIFILLPSNYAKGGPSWLARFPDWKAIGGVGNLPDPSAGGIVLEPSEPVQGVAGPGERRYRILPTYLWPRAVPIPLERWERQPCARGVMCP